MDLLKFPEDLFTGMGNQKPDCKDGVLCNSLSTISKYLDKNSINKLASSCKAFNEIKMKMINQLTLDYRPKIEYLNDYQRLLIWKMYMMRMDMYDSSDNTIHYYPTYNIPELCTPIFMIFNDKVSIDKPVEYLRQRISEGNLLDNYINTEGETYKYNDWIPYRRLIVEALDDPCDESFWNEYYAKHNERWWKYPRDYSLTNNYDDNIDLPVHNLCYEKCLGCSNIYDPIWCGKITNSEASGDWGILTGPKCSNRRIYWDNLQNDDYWTFKNECRFIQSYILSG